MLTFVHIPLPADKVEKVRSFINMRFADRPGQTLNAPRLVAHDALDQILSGNDSGAKVRIAKLDEAGACEFRACLARNGITLSAT